MKKILIYLGDQQTKKEILQRVMKDLSLTVVFLSDKDLNYTCGYLMGLLKFDAKQKEGSYHFTEDLMLLNDIKDKDILAINALLKTLGIEMQRKAMLTTHNQYWYLCDLIQEIEQEHRFFQQKESIRTMLSQSNTLQIDEYTQDSWQNYEQAFHQAYDVIIKDVTVQVMNETYLNLLHAKQQLQKK